MALIPSTSTFKGLATEIRQRIFEHYFSESPPAPLLLINLAINLDNLNTSALPRSEIRRFQNYTSPLFLVSKRIAAEARQVRFINLDIDVYDKPELMTNDSAFDKIPVQLRSLVRTVKVYDLRCWRTRDGILQHFPLAVLFIFSILKQITFFCTGKELMILPTEPITCRWRCIDSSCDALMTHVGEMAFLEGDLDKDIEIAMRNQISELEKLVPLGSSNLNLRLSFRLRYIYSVPPVRAGGSPLFNINTCQPIWSYERKRFIAEEDGKILCWERKKYESESKESGSPALR